MDCSQDVDECIWEPGVCEDKDNTVCRNLYGSYTCDCKPGYTGSRCQFITTTESLMTTGQSVSPSSSTVSSNLFSIREYYNGTVKHNYKKACCKTLLAL